MRKFRLSDFDYFLPSGLIAQYPLERGKEKLLVFHKKSGKIEHRVFENIVDYFQPGDMLLLNNTKVIKARVFTRRKSGGKVEVFFLNKIDDFSFKGLLRPYSRVKVGEVFEFDKCKLKVEDKEMGYAIFKLEGLDVKSFFEIYGKMPFSYKKKTITLDVKFDRLLVALLNYLSISIPILPLLGMLACTGSRVDK